MLSRSAQGLYWMGRYLERAEYLCRLLRLQVEALVDRPIQEIYFGWSRVYISLNRHPPGGKLELLGDDNYTLADSYTLADDLTFEPVNPDSVRSCFVLGRENARQMRHCISAEMWTSLNLAYLRLQQLSIQEIWKVSPENFYAETANEIHTFTGAAEVTMYRDKGWHFWRLGRFMERTQCSTALLLAHLATARRMRKSSGLGWISLLRFAQALDAYNRNYSIEVQPRQVLNLLVTDPLLPSSLCRSLEAVAEELDAIGPGPSAHSSAVARRLAGRLCALIHYDWPEREDQEDLIREIRENCLKLHDLVGAAYIDYAVEDSPVH